MTDAAPSSVNAVRPWLGGLALVQGAVFAFAASILWARWQPAGIVAAACAALQVVGAVGWFMRRPAVARWAALGTVVGGALIFGMYLQAVHHIMGAYGPEARTTGTASLGVVLLAAPWLFAIPVAQAIHAFGWKPGAAALVALILPIAWGAAGRMPTASWDEGQPVLEAAEAAHARWHGGASTLPTGSGPAVVLLTAWSAGEPSKSVRGDGADLAAALTDALGKMPPPKSPADALVLDVATRTYPKGVLIRAGTSGGLNEKGGLSPTVGWRPSTMRYVEPVPEWRVPVLKPEPNNPTVFVSAIASSDGVHAIEDGWTAPPDVTAETLLDTAREAGMMLVRNQEADGQFAYRVGGPSGKLLGGYNYPRHAGTTWFLARLAERTGDPVFEEATRKGLRFMADQSETLSEDRSAVKDPTRKDGKIWVGTTALATLAALSAGDPMAESWGRFVASSIDDRGAVRGDLTIETGTFPPQPLNSYGQGQASLALAALVRSGATEFEPASRRAFQFIEGGYGPGAANKLLTIDEHWMCLAALVGSAVHGTPAGSGICRTYLENEAISRQPRPGSALLPASGPAGGLAEAVVAGAYLHPEAPFRELAYRYGWLFVRNAYRPSDAPFLGNPRTLLGGFRDTLSDLDVQMDSVQHIGCAVLGIEALLSGEIRPGALP